MANKNWIMYWQWLANGKVHADIDSKNQYLTGLVSLDALTNSKKLEATLVADVRDVNLYSLEVTKAPMRLSLCVIFISTVLKS